MLKILKYIGVGFVSINLLVSGVYVLSSAGDQQAAPETLIDHGEMPLLSEAPPPAPPVQAPHEQKVADGHGGGHEPDHAKTEEVSDLPVCYKIGPIHQQQQVESIQRGLEELEISTVILSQDKGKVLGYWVYLKPERSRALARLKMEELKGKGVTDMFLVKKGEPKLAISLGVYRNKLTAQKRQKHMRRLGYEAQLKLRYKVKPETWLLIEADKENRPSTDGWKLLLKDYQGVNSEKSDC